MALKISGTEVINNSRALVNIAGASGVYNDFHPSVTDISSNYQIDMTKPVMTVTMTSSTAFPYAINGEPGRTCKIIIDRTASNYTVTFQSNVKWPNNTTPPFANNRYWLVTFDCYNSVTFFATAVPFNS